MAARWMGPIPTDCDVCKRPLKVCGDTFTDGKTIYGPWANMCPECHREVGCGTGVGRGQVYNLADGVKIS